MYKIYYNDKTICLLHKALESQIRIVNSEAIMVNYSGKTKLILACIDKLDKNHDVQTIYILAEDLNRLKVDFFSLFEVVRAAGGLVVNSNSEMLMIFRRGNWDLPKGKIERNETKKQSAIREVKEETGLIDVDIITKLCTTYHIYSLKSGKRALKPSYWYLMFSNNKNVVPQVEEDIELVEWVKLSDYRDNKYLPIYANITDAIQQFEFKFIELL